MSEPFLAQITIVSFNFAPSGMAFCDGQILPINQNQSLYSLLGTTYGGDGQTSFALPDLRGRTPIHVSAAHALGQKGGEENHTLGVSEMPAHTHGLRGSGASATQPGPSGKLLAKSSLSGGTIYSTTSETDDVSLANMAISNTGTGQGHNNMQPSLAVSFCIALQGVFPSSN